MAIEINEDKELVKRASQATSSILADNIWIATISSTTTTITPYAIDSVTVSASPISASATPWVSLDSSGIPYGVEPTVTDGSTISASPTATNSNYPTQLAAPPVLLCMNERVPEWSDESTPFCIKNATELLVGETYWITWNPLYWNPTEDSSDVQKVKLRIRPYPEDDSANDLMSSDWIENNNGFFAWPVQSSEIYSDNDGYCRIEITPRILSGTDAHNMDTKTGPILRIIESKDDATTEITRVPSDNASSSLSSSSSTSTNSSFNSTTSTKGVKDSTSKTKIIVPAVVVPVVVAILSALIVFTCLLKKRKSGFSNPVKIRLTTFSKGYQGSSKQRMGKSENKTSHESHSKDYLVENSSDKT